MSDLRVIATIPIKPESVEELRPALIALAEGTRAEEGCLSYELFESAAAPGVFVTVEEWRGQDDLDAHMQTEHVGAALAAAEGHLAGDIAIHPLVPVG
ncbi:antibiotic biosynthesis monooxygenase [Nocardioides mangrovicus]|uniref:Antibiotic biosynthesis monooxygenase n=1 Tax=Nocardioides mangrovicus TaxID=2478913 RepID=A0A3L8P6F0_9ACTN|nr:putative quinol monooxygenase [Nocardioides mangrovicus]RLV50018.1 antibiotic biosynthesis monooxygenase [Nocardioides mangrovicus]